ncbi:hypothetical protein PVAP13_2NG519503 [Panicum virgatum]|uniref:Uncharacterized protein n=1 Tax=Panicum virgatum TaxID=38727 RepID=A0A8T0VR62_PANVG|nr:hypothetical protein PVAP13_2NG519503 [Panicum virgatum]
MTLKTNSKRGDTSCNRGVRRTERQAASGQVQGRRRGSGGRWCQGKGRKSRIRNQRRQGREGRRRSGGAGESWGGDGGRGLVRRRLQRERAVTALLRRQAASAADQGRPKKILNVSTVNSVITYGSLIGFLLLTGN